MLISGCVLHVGRHELARAGNAVGAAVEAGIHARIGRVHHEVLEQLGILDILGILQDSKIVAPVDVASFGQPNLMAGFARRWRKAEPFQSLEAAKSPDPIF